MKRIAIALLLCAIVSNCYGAEGTYQPSPQAIEILQQGERLHNNMQFPEAQALLEKAARDYPEDVEIRYLLGLSAFGAGDYITSVKALEWAVLKRPEDAEARLRLAMAYRKLAETNRAANNIKLAETQEELADTTYAKAYEMLVEEAEASPEDVKLNSALGKAAMGRKEYEVAIMAFSQVLEQSPGDNAARTGLAGAYYRQGLEYNNQGRKELAQDNFSRAQSEFAVLCDEFESSYEGKKLPQPGARDYATFSLLYLNLAKSAVGAGDYKAALQAYEALLEVNPDDGGTWLQLGDLYSRMNEPKKAEEAYHTSYRLLSAAKESDPQNVDLLYSLAQAALGADKTPEAIQYYEEMLKLDPSRHAAQMALAELYRREGQNDRADAEYAEVYDKLQQKYLDDSSNLGT
ncbi:MAG: tetratricopeptide repeat protein, partial [Planctomycetes bacterium]|nr:tetratricopeptide repeat protein [Planctomycetota bacterium]